MKNTKLSILLLSGSLLTAFGATAADEIAATPAMQDSAYVHFRQSKWNLDPDFEANGRNLDALLQRLQPAMADSSLRLSRIRVVGGASPEGSVDFNRELSHHRATSIFNYLKTRISLPDSLTAFEFLGRDWQGLRRLAADDPSLPDREHTLALIDNIISTSGQRHDGVERLKALDAGRPYRYMYTHIFPTLRASRVFVDFDSVIRPRVIAEPQPEPVDLGFDFSGDAGIEVDFPAPLPEEKKPFYMALKTNMLYDALAVPNLGAEFYLGKNWSVAGNWMYAWWSNDSKHRYWRIYGGDIALRKWFGKAAHDKPLTGHHLGLYAGIVTYDFELGGKGYMGGIPGGTIWDRCQYVAGIEYGYSLPIAKRLNIDFTIGLGYRGGKCVEYEPDKKFYIWESTKHINWIGPTKAEISLVWLIGRGNTNIKKGGAL